MTRDIGIGVVKRRGNRRVEEAVGEAVWEAVEEAVAKEAVGSRRPIDKNLPSLDVQ